MLRGLVIFGAASAGCALAPTAAALVAARAVQGIGAALLLPGSVAAIADAFPGRAEQARALGTWAAVSAIAVPAGPLLGGFLVQSYGWRSVFWINPPVIVVCVIGVITWAKATRGRRERRLDLGGLALGTIGLAALVYAVIAAGGNGTAGSPRLPSARSRWPGSSSSSAGWLTRCCRRAYSGFRRSPSRTGRRW